jgi:hypothetical protein
MPERTSRGGRRQKPFKCVFNERKAAGSGRDEEKGAFSGPFQLYGFNYNPGFFSYTRVFGRIGHGATQ